MRYYPWLIPLFPLIAVVINGLFGRKYIREKAHYLGVGSVAISFLLSVIVFLEVALGYGSVEVSLYEWVTAGSFKVNVGFLIDPLSAIMLLVVAGVGLLVHIYSVGYMHGDGGYYRYFTYINLFMFSMLLLVLANNYLLMFVGWEGVGLCSYLLIGFWFERKSAADAGKKAFVVNRIGDAGFLLGIFLLFATFGTLNYSEIFPRVEEVSVGIVTAITLCLFLGAIGKSAQIPLYVWLPDAMEGPTPVSALIHAATMVTAGVYMVARSNVLYSAAPFSAELVAVIGGLTAIFAASIGLVQNDIKRVLAYSTVSQLGYMFLGAGVGAYVAGIFHLMTHAFFKGLLFLCSGSVIHALSGEQDMRRMGGLRPYLPTTHWTFLVGAIAIAGIPPLAGFWSKDEILAEAFKNGHYLLWLIGVVAAFMTAFYMFRLIFLTFYGPSRVSEEAMHHLHESPPVMTIPLVVLAILSIIGGLIPGFPPEAGWIHRFLEPVLGGGHQAASAHVAFAAEAAHAVEEGGFHVLDAVLMLISIAVGVAGILVAYYFYILRPDTPEKLSQRFSALYELLLNKYWVDEFYDTYIVENCKRFAHFLWGAVDVKVIDDGLVNGASNSTVRVSSFSGDIDLRTVDGAVNGVSVLITVGARVLRYLQTGFVQNYLLFMVLGIFVIITLYLVF
ncbi:MAG: NADH-quinone oxidoreductase subunit L [Nitrospinota bacterium]|nr:MAG: NADH-quinone oxidoreductase subunit L [Nitrospinota bacterium]